MLFDENTVPRGIRDGLRLELQHLRPSVLCHHHSHLHAADCLELRDRSSVLLHQLMDAQTPVVQNVHAALRTRCNSERMRHAARYVVNSREGHARCNSKQLSGTHAHDTCGR